MANRKKNKLDLYAETRIWNLKLRDRSITTDDLIREMIFRFNLTGKASLYLKLQKTVLAARRRVMRRRTAVKKKIRTWASKLFLPEKIVAPLVWKERLTEDNFNIVFDVLVAYRTAKEAEKAEMADV